MWEEFVNDFTTPLHTAINNSIQTIIPNSEIGAPSATPFRIIIDNEIILITSGLGTGTWHGLRGYEGTVAAAHSAGATIQHLLTAGMLQYLRDRMPVVDIYKYGAVGDGATDNHAQVQSALNDGAATYPNGCVYMMGRSGDVFNYGTPGVDIPNNSILWFPYGVRHQRNFVSTVALFSQFSGTAFGSKIALLGPGSLGAAGSTIYGPILTLRVNDLWLQDITIDGFYADIAGSINGIAYNVSGDRMRVYAVKSINPGMTVHTGGFRVSGGRNGRIIGAHIESGDDALQFVPIGSSAGTVFADQTVEDFQYIGCTAVSYKARGIVALLVDGTIAGGMHSSVIDCGWTDCSIKGGARQVVIQNVDSDGTIKNVGTKGGSIDCSLGTTSTPQEVWVDNAANIYGGTVKDTYIKTRIKHPLKKNIHLSNGVDGVEIDIPGLEMPSAGALQFLQVDQASRVRLKLHTIDATGATADIVVIGAGATTATDVIIEDTEITNIPATFNGINYNNVVKGVVRRNLVAGAGIGIRVGAGSSASEVYSNDVSGITGTKISDSATDTLRYRNRGDTQSLWWPPGYAFAALAANFDFTNTAAFLTVNAMAVPVINTGYYRVRGVFLAQGDTAADIRIAIAAPGSSVWAVDVWDGLVVTATTATSGHNSPAEINAVTTTTSVNMALLGATTPSRIVFDGYLQVLASGNLTPKVQQNVQTVVTSTLLAGSFLEAQRVA